MIAVSDRRDGWVGLSSPIRAGDGERRVKRAQYESDAPRLSKLTLCEFPLAASIGQIPHTPRRKPYIQNENCGTIIGAPSTQDCNLTRWTPAASSESLSRPPTRRP